VDEIGRPDGRRCEVGGREMPRTMLVLDGRTRGMVCDLYFLGYPPWIGLRKPHLDRVGRSGE
jgi:hypothetical protein